MSTAVQAPPSEAVLQAFHKYLLHHIRQTIVDDLVKEKLIDVEKELRARLQPEVERLTLETIRNVDLVFDNKAQILVAWNHEITVTEIV